MPCMAFRRADPTGSNTAYSISRRKPLPDTIEWVKVSSVAWRGRRVSTTAAIPLRRRQRALLVERKSSRLLSSSRDVAGCRRAGLRGSRRSSAISSVETTEDERFEILHVYDRAAGKKGNAVFVRDRARSDATLRAVHCRHHDDSYPRDRQRRRRASRPHRQRRAKRPHRQNRSGRSGRGATGRVSLPRQPEPLERATTAGGKLFAVYMKNVTRASAACMPWTAQFEHDVECPALAPSRDSAASEARVRCSIPSRRSRADRRSTGTTSRRATSTVFRALGDARIRCLGVTRRGRSSSTSKDGTRVPMFLVHRKGLAPDGTNPG